MKKELKKSLVRGIFSIILLVIVWFHAHWSVALSLTLITIAIEGEALLTTYLLKSIREIKEILELILKPK